MSDDPLEFMDQIDVDERRPRKKVGDFADPVGETVDRKQASKATGKKDSTIAGQYIRYGFTWTPGQLEMIEKIADELNLSKNSAARWLMDQGLKDYMDGARPEIVDRTVRAEPRLENW